MSRAARRSLGKRRLRRGAHADVSRIIELSEEGRSPSAISSSVGLPEEFVQEVLEQAEAARKSEIQG